MAWPNQSFGTVIGLTQGRFISAPLISYDQSGRGFCTGWITQLSPCVPILATRGSIMYLAAVGSGAYRELEIIYFMLSYYDNYDDGCHYLIHMIAGQ